MDPWTEETYTELRSAIVRSAAGRQEALGLCAMLRGWLRDVKASLNSTTGRYVPDLTAPPCDDGTSYTWAMLDALDAAFVAGDSHHADVLCQTAEAHADIVQTLVVMRREVT